MLKVNCPSELVVRAFMAVPAESRRRMCAPTTGACDTLSNTTPVRVWARAETTSAKRIVVIRIERSTILIHRNQKGGAFPFAAPTAPYLVLRRCHRLHSRRIHAHLKPLLVLVLEFHVTIDGREQRIVRGAPHVLSGMELGAALDDDDRPGPHEFPAEPLHAEVLRIRVASVARGADALLMSHAVLSRSSRRRF